MLSCVTQSTVELQHLHASPCYRLLGVDRVVIYNTSCGPDLNHLLQSYSQEGFVEMVPWPIDKHMNPSHGWFFSTHGGDMHYYGQIATLNECLYRYMDQSRYVLLHDIDEIMMPYKHDSLQVLLDLLQEQLPKVEKSVCVNLKHNISRSILILIFLSFQLYPCSAGWCVSSRKPYLSQETLSQK